MTRRGAAGTDGGDTNGGGTVTVYTDGGASPNPGPGGWAAVLLRERAEPEELSGGEPETTNNRMELTAAIRALEAVPAGTEIDLHTDSQYLRQGITSWLPGWVTRGWKRSRGGRVENEDLWRRLASLAHDRDVRWSWVRGHAGDRWNERADRLATAAIRRQRGVGGASPAAAERAGGEPELEVWLKVSAAGGHGGWAARVRGRSGAGGGDRELSGAVTPVSANRLDLLAAAEVLEGLPAGARVAFHTGSDYLRNGATSWVDAWRRRGWKTKDGKPVANRAEWERLAAATARRKVSWPRGRDDEETAEVWKALERRARVAREEAG